MNLEQHRSELHEFTCMWVFSSLVNNTVRQNPQLVESADGRTRDMEELRIKKTNDQLYIDFLTVQWLGVPNPWVVQVSVVFPNNN